MVDPSTILIGASSDHGASIVFCHAQPHVEIPGVAQMTTEMDEMTVQARLNLGKPSDALIGSRVYKLFEVEAWAGAI